MRHDNDFFSRGRFAAYFRKLWIEEWRATTTGTCMLFGTFLLIEALAVMVTYGDRFYPGDSDYAHALLGGAFVFLIFVLGCVMSARILRGGGRKTQRVTMLTLPVTGFEMWLARWVMTVPLFLLGFLACFYLADLIRVAVCGSPFPNDSIGLTPLWRGGSEGFLDFLIVVRTQLLCSALYTAGGVFFPRRPLLKTSVVMFLLIWFYIILDAFGNDILFSRRDTAAAVAGNLFWWSAIPFLWWLSYARFKELDIID